MAQGLDFDLNQLVLFNGTFGPREIKQLTDAIGTELPNFHLLRDAVAELRDKEDQSPASMVRLGVCLYLLGQHQRAIETLKQGDGGALAHFYLAKACFALRKYDDALQSYTAAAKAGYDSDECALGRAETQRYAGNATAALAILDGLSGAIEQTAEYLYQRGATVAALGGNPNEVVALYERAVEADGEHCGALFGLALENDRRGNDETALDLYRRSASRFPPHAGSLLNLGILYEDRGQFDQAVRCYRRVFNAYPDNDRARLFLRDAQASSDMY